MTGLVTIEAAEGVAVVTLNRPEAMNALSRALRGDLAAAIRTTSEDPDVRVVILTGAGQRAFSAGVDLKELAEGIRDDRDPGIDPVIEMTACRKPIIGAINGAAMTGGFELALACDILIASTNARFADTHVKVGVSPGWGLSQKLARIMGPSRAKEMSLSGRFIDAQTALAWGLVNQVTAPEALLPAARELALSIAANAPPMVAHYKALIDDGYALSYGEALDLEQARFNEHLSRRDPALAVAARDALDKPGRDPSSKG
jgi:enoyl-CoA hydratase